MKTGIPTDINLYHPIEFLELDKFSRAFLDAGLEYIKGGIRNQLLVGHIVHFVQDRGIDSIESLPRFKKEYLSDLLSKAKLKGIDLKKAQEGSFNLNWGRMKQLSHHNQIYAPGDSFDQASNIYSSSNYKMFRFLEFNRDIDIKHVRSLMESMKRNGILSYPLMILTDCVDGIPTYWIIDGQHRFEAMKRLGIPIWFTLYQKQSSQPITLYDLVRLVADVNNTSKAWGILQYLKAWKSLKVREYVKLDEQHQLTGLPVTLLLQAYSGLARGRATKLFVQGAYKMEDEKRGNDYVSHLKILRPLIPRSSSVYTHMLEFLRNSESYSNTQMQRALRKADLRFFMSENDEEVMSNLKLIYENAA